jgi:hypothetical protein
VIGVDGLTAQGFGVDALFDVKRVAELPGGGAQAESGSDHPIGGRPRHGDLTGGVGAKLDVQLFGRRRASHGGLAKEGRAGHRLAGF